MGTGSIVAASCSIFSILQGISHEMNLKIGPVCAAIYWFEYPLTKRTRVCVMAMNHFSKTVVYLNPATSVWQPASSFDHWRYSKSKHFSTLSALERRDTRENFQMGLSLYAMRFGFGIKNGHLCWFYEIKTYLCWPLKPRSSNSLLNIPPYTGLDSLWS